MGIEGSSSSPIQEHYAVVNGARMRYLRAGFGAPVVLLHGLLGYSFSWRFTIPFVAQHATVYAPDMLGAGFSDRVRGMDCRVTALADLIIEFLHAVGVPAFDFVATSHGGAIAMLVAAKCADAASSCRPKRLVLVAPVNPWSRHGRLWAPFLGSSIGSFLFLRGVAHRAWLPDLALRRLYADPAKIPPGTIEGYTKPYEIPGSFEYGISVARCWTAALRDLELALPKIANYPTLLIWGNRDRAVDPNSAAPLKKAFKQCELVMLDGIGHLPYEEAPEEFNRALLNFLKSPPREF